MKPILPRIKKYLIKYKIFRPYLKQYIQKNGYIFGYLTLIKIVIGDGLRSIYRQLVAFENQTIQNTLTILNKEEIHSCLYVIVAPDYISSSAGIHCLYKLCHDLRKKGYTAGIYGSNVTPDTLDAPLIPEKYAKEIRLNDAAWVVYPETILGNPLKFKNVARWVLNRPGLLGGDEVYHPEEKIFVYSNVYVPYVKNTIQGKLYMPSFDGTVFYPPKEEYFSKNHRQLACYYVGKSTYKDGYFDKKETFEITRSSPAKQELGKLFRSAKILYSFDNSTALIYEAIACGCPVQIIPDGTQTWEDYEKLEWGTTGIFWDKPVVDLKWTDANLLIEKIKLTNDRYKLELDNFIEKTVGGNYLRNIILEK